MYVQVERTSTFICLSTMLPFAFLSYPDWHKSDEVFEEACQAESSVATQLLQRHLNSDNEK